jgi:hypothetical protein
MKKLILTLTLCLIYIQCFGWGSNAPSMFMESGGELTEPSECGILTQNIYSPLDDSTGLVQDRGTWTFTTGTVYNATTTTGFLRSTTSNNAECQWGVAVAGDDIDDTGSVNIFGMFFRYTDLASNAYALRYNTSSYSLEWVTVNGGSTVDYIQDVTIPQLHPNDRLAWQVSGTDDATVLNIWISPPTEWGTPDYTFTNNPVAPVNTGGYVGLYGRKASGTAPVKYLAFSAGN